MANFWLNIGWEVASLMIPVLIGGLLYRKYVAPSINEAVGDVQEAVTKITNVAKLAGVKSQEYATAKNIEKVVAEDLIRTNIPELEALKMVLSPSTWEQIEDTIQENPEAVLQLWEKYGPILEGRTAQRQPTDF